ncbi:MAG: NADP-dependent malic enzyme [Cytophagales bacterium]|nr:NADP-dependent malic enzyme [Bernardetiaceae bacterium]MDW8211783.1 NADP-dependent malic enzyme [Cytophagales bacterium]
MAAKIRKQDALDYHALERPGKIEVVPTKATKSQRDLALAYSPGVAEPCLEIARNPEEVYKYTTKGNLVAVISNGTAVLGLGDIGPEASKPVMEGKGILFKVFAGIDVFDLELNCRSVEEFVKVVKALEPTFGGINLEDIKAPDCFEIEERLKKEMRIPVMHDDQHGTAIITAAALINAAELAGKKIPQMNIVFSGAGASAISCARLFLKIGAQRQNIILCDSKGVVHADRTDLDKYKREFATTRKVHTLQEALVGADVLVGLSKANVVEPAWLLTMAKKPIVFALANPDPEIAYDVAIATRSDIIMATGRSDYPNQVNNVLGFPFIFRGALDVRATEINDAMKLAAVYAIANLARKPVPEIVNIAYNQPNITFGPNYFIPKPLDPRLLTTVAPAVAKAAMESGVARLHITDWEEYENQLRRRMGSDDNIMRVLVSKAKQDPQRVIFAEADNYSVLKAAQIVLDEGIAKPILLGERNKIAQIIAENGLDLSNVPIIDPLSPEAAEQCRRYGDIFFDKRKRRGYNYNEAHRKVRERNYFGMLMLHEGEADALISGLTRKYESVLRPALEIIGPTEVGKKVSGMYMILTRQGPIFMADTTVIQNPTTEELVDIALFAAEAVRQFDIEPRIAMLSYSNFGSSNDPEPTKVRKAVEILKKQHPHLCVDGEIQANVAFSKEILQENYPFSELVAGAPNILIFPNLAAGNIAYKLMQAIGGAEAVGPIILGMRKAVHVLQLGSSVREIVNMTTIAVVDAQNKKRCQQ